MQRNREFYYPDETKPKHYKCDICQSETHRAGDYINSHIIAHAHAKRLSDSRKTNKRLPTSPSYICNGLFLCRTCDKYFEEHVIIIAADGTISVQDQQIRNEKPYKKLHNRKVSWASLIDIDVDWPTSGTLEFRNQLPSVTSRHSGRKYGVDEDDVSTSSEYAPEDNNATSGSDSRKRKRASAHSEQSRSGKLKSKR